VNWIRRFFLFCSGADVSILKRDECSTQQGRQAGIGATILLTATLASLSGGYALFTVFQSFLVAAGFGLLWGIMIFNLDRVIVQSMKKKQGAILNQLMIAVPRFLVAVLISLVVAVPLELKIFEREIIDDIASTNVIKETEQAHNIESKFHEITDIGDQNRALLAAVSAKEGARDKALDEAMGEALGTRGTHIKGAGPVWRQKTNYLTKVDQELNSVRAANTQQVQRNNDRIEGLKESRDKEIEERKKTIQQATGLLARIEALHNLARNRTTAGAILLISLLFLLIETAPVVVKLLSPYGPYDAILERQEAEVVQSEGQKILDIREKANYASANDIKMNQDMREFEYEQFNEVVKTARLSRDLVAVHDEVASEVVKGLRNSMLATVRDLFGRSAASPDPITAKAARRVQAEARNAIRKEGKETAAFKAKVEQAKAGVVEELRQYGNNGSIRNSKAN
jgi:hypothetical protein